MASQSSAGDTPRGMPEEAESRLSEQEARRAGSLSIGQLAALGAIFAIALLLGFLLYCRAIVPFEPYHAYGYEVSPEKVCPGGEVRTTVDREVGPGAEELEYASYWLRTGKLPYGPPPEGPPRWPGDSGFLNAAEAPREKITSPVLRTAPDTPGMWVLHTTLKVHGHVGPVEREQEVTMVARDTPLYVLRDGDPRC